jgi:hypothetical protein
LTGGFSRAIHFIESDKGWTTEYIMGLPLCRIRQLLELIAQDKREQMKFHAQLVEWQTRNIASMFTVAARDKKQAKSIEKAVKHMTLPLEDEEADVIDTRSAEQIMEQGALVDLESQPSFEALDTFFNVNKF